MFDHTSTDHEEIKVWAQKHNLKPAFIETEDIAGEKRGLRFDAPGAKDEALLTEVKQSQDVAWDQFFTEFETQNLALMYNDKFDDPTAGYKFIPR